jgi:hypothetical protein
MSGIDAMTVLKGVCLASGAAMHVAPLPTMREIRAARNTLNFHIAPYASTLLNHLVNLWYAIIRRDGPLIIHRICGITAQAYYNVTYLTYCPPHKQADSRRWLTWVGGILVGIFAWLHLLLPLAGATEQYNAHIGFFGAITGIGLAASPLATVVRKLWERTLLCAFACPSVGRILLTPLCSFILSPASLSPRAGRGPPHQGRLVAPRPPLCDGHAAGEEKERH